jgi:hypothetical protein
MPSRAWTLLRRHPKAELWRQDRQDPSGQPISIFRGSVFVELPGGERRKTPDDPIFSTFEEGAAWFDRATAE